MKWGIPLYGMFLLFGIVMGCDQMDQMGTEDDTRDGVCRVTNPDATQPDSWKRLSGVNQRLVSPVWSPTGQWLLARGWGGVGLAILSARDGEVRFRDSEFRGPIRFVAPGVLRLGGMENGTEVRWSPEAGNWRTTRTSSALDFSWDDRLGTRLVSGGAYDVYHHAYDGTITQVSGNQDEVLVEDRGAWGVAVTGDGKRMAYSLGSLTEPRFLVYDPEGGLREVGAGAQPAWLPGERYVVFTKPWPGPSTTTGQGYATDLFVYDVETSTTTQLTDTEAIAEMEPAVSPDGRSLAFADWNSGALYVIAMPELPAAGSAGEGVAP
jgi:hypothetical protein